MTLFYSLTCCWFNVEPQASTGKDTSTVTLTRELFSKSKGRYDVVMVEQAEHPASKGQSA